LSTPLLSRAVKFLEDLLVGLFSHDLPALEGSSLSPVEILVMLLGEIS